MHSLNVELKVDPVLTLTDMVINIDGAWTPVEELHEGQPQLTADGETRVFAASIDLTELARLVQSKARRSDVESTPSPTPQRASLFVRATSAGEVPSMAREAEYYGHDNDGEDNLGFVDNGGATFLLPVGKASQTFLPELQKVVIGETCITPYSNKRGILTFVVDGSPSVGGRPVNERMTLENGELIVEGRINVHSNSISRLELSVVGRTSGFKLKVPADFSYDVERTRRKFGSRLYKFSARCGLETVAGQLPNDTLDLYVEFDGPQLEEPIRRRFGRSRYLVRRRSRSTRVSHGGKTILLTPYYTFKAKNPSIYSEVFDSEVFEHMRSSVAERKGSYKHRPEVDKPVWVVGELPYKAQDNGLHFFKYLRDNHPEIDAYYVVEPESPERSNLAGYDHVIAFRSKQHVDVALAADRFIGTHHPDYLYPTRSPRFGAAVASAPKIFLQHGVMGAKWMVPNYGKKSSDFVTDLVITSSEREKQIFIKDFGYSADEVAVTGLARFDALFANDVDVRREQILIIPTWRPWLQDPETFTESAYYERWSSLLSAEAITGLVEKHGYQIVFCLHPNMQQFTRHFDRPGVTVVSQGEVDVQYLLKRSAVMITDYSSVAFDFSFLDKPVAYYQFDSRRFAQPHVSAQEELPGPTFVDEDELTTWLTDVLMGRNDDVDEYRRRSHRFLAHRDRRASERTFEAITAVRKSHSPLTRAIHSEEASAAGRLLRRHKQYRPVMKQVYKLLRALPIDPNVIIFESGQGRQLGDNPGAIYDELVKRGDTRLKVWIYNKRFPIRDDQTIIVKKYSPEYFWYLARAKYWVSNQNMPHFIHRRNKGVYIQTWHGTPLKKMFLDIDQIVGRDEGYVGRVTEATRQWSVLVSPNPYTTDIMRSAYAFGGPSVELGYPRNDVLLNEAAEDRRKSVRQQLGFTDSDFVVLYAPTFRDDKPTTRGRFAFEWPFPPEEFEARFASTDVKLLIRAHVLINTKIHVPTGSETITDVTKLPDIQELYLASDMLVTDYSSVFFDFSLLKRPICFYAHDLEKYRQELRGFYLDYSSELPGPIVENAESLYRAIDTARETGSLEGSVQLADFVDRFASSDDGRATERVVDTLLDPGGTAAKFN
ncbi:CDP-glycerol glycerophosphotransferase family protein [Brevibacterium sp. LE-L]|uniref:CDP-glycerol glycerophosphotransferase family protein n=1 Tax=Brevibacterium sp. LE-L TaxID=3418557 RepID=UPI003CF8DF91